MKSKAVQSRVCRAEQFRVEVFKIIFCREVGLNCRATESTGAQRKAVQNRFINTEQKYSRVLQN